MKKNCEVCGVKYVTDKSASRFCGSTCAMKGRRSIAVSRAWVPCSMCLASVGVGHKRAARILNVRTPVMVWREWEQRGVKVNSCLVQAIAKTKRKPEWMKTAEAIIMAQYKADDSAFVVWKAPRKTQMEKYYEDHEASKERSRITAGRSYHRRIKVDADFTARLAVRRTVARLYANGAKRKDNSRTHHHLGCSIEDARRHIESQWKNGWSWSNHGTVWEIDHIIPLASFDLSNPSHVAMAAHYTNLQPLCKRQNRMKSDSVPMHQPRLLL